MTTELPLISVITVVYNDVKTIEKTILNVLNQSYSNLEYVIIDGNSTDGTVDIINKYRDRISYFVSEPDKGIYDAMNKGIRAASGEWINFMNSGDWFYNLDTVAELFQNRDLARVKLIYGNTERREGNSRHISIPGQNLGFFHNVMVHQSIFSRRELSLKYLFNTDYKVAADFDFIFRVFFYRHATLYVDLPIASYNVVGFSNLNRYRGFKEKRQAALSYKGNPILSGKVYLYFLYDALRGKSIDFLKSFMPQIYTRLKAHVNRNVSYYGQTSPRH